jgi:hypothetical protein
VDSVYCQLYYSCKYKYFPLASELLASGTPGIPSEHYFGSASGAS